MQRPHPMGQKNSNMWKSCSNLSRPDNFGAKPQSQYNWNAMPQQQQIQPPLHQWMQQNYNPYVQQNANYLQRMPQQQQNKIQPKPMPQQHRLVQPVQPPPPVKKPNGLPLKKQPKPAEQPKVKSVVVVPKTNPNFNWVPLPAEEMPRHPIALATINYDAGLSPSKPPPASLPKTISPVAPVSVVKPPTQPPKIETPALVKVTPVHPPVVPKPQPVVQPKPLLPPPAEPVRQPTPPIVYVNKPPAQLISSHPVESSPFTKKPHPRIIYDNQPQHEQKAAFPTAKSVLHYAPSFIEKIKNTPVRSLQSRLLICQTEKSKTSESIDSGVLNETISTDNNNIKKEKAATSPTTKICPVVQEESHTLAMRLYDLLLKYPGGVVEKHLPVVYQKATGNALPDNWVSVVTTYSRLFAIESNPLAHVVYAIEIIGDVEFQPDDGDAAAELQLPWTAPHWNLYITHVASTVMIYARLIGGEFSARLDGLSADIEQFMEVVENRRAAEEVTVDGVYLVEKEKSWYRVRCREVNEKDEKFQAFFIDHGIEEWLPMGKAIVCENKFMALPAQAILFSLFGLQSMDENPHAPAILQRRLSEQSVVAEILTRAEDYVEGATISAVFWDTTGEVDLNLDEVLHDEICSAGTQPQLKVDGFTQVVITHVSDNGIIHCLVPGNGVEYVNKMVDKLAQNEELLSQHRGLRETVSCGNNSATRYLVRDAETNKWYRALLKVRHPQTSQHIMLCLDTGFCLRVDEKDVYHLDPLSTALSRYPAMALRIEMYNIPKFSPQVVARLKGLLQPGSSGLVKVVSEGGATGPVVNLYQRLTEKKMIVSINDTLRMESDLESLFAG